MAERRNARLSLSVRHSAVGGLHDLREAPVTRERAHLQGPHCRAQPAHDHRRAGALAPVAAAGDRHVRRGRGGPGRCGRARLAPQLAHAYGQHELVPHALGAPPLPPMVAVSITYDCSLHHYGCSLHHLGCSLHRLWLQVRHLVLASHSSALGERHNPAAITLLRMWLISAYVPILERRQ
eukprot:scaffold112422_cov34-Phaeocystis_antarctica.AAC.1